MCMFVLQTSIPHEVTAAADTHTELNQLPHLHVHSCTCICIVLCYSVTIIYHEGYSPTAEPYYFQIYQLELYLNIDKEQWHGISDIRVSLSLGLEKRIISTTVTTTIKTTITTTTITNATNIAIMLLLLSLKLLIPLAIVRVIWMLVL
jgi:hypothetical protein